MHILLAQFYSSTPTPEYENIEEGLRQRGHQVWVMTPSIDGELLVRDGGEIIAWIPFADHEDSPSAKLRLPDQLSVRARNWTIANRVKDFIDSVQPDIVQLHPAGLVYHWTLPLRSVNGTRFIVDWRQVDEREYFGQFGGLKRWIHLQRRRIPSRYLFDLAAFLHPAGARQVLGDSWQKWGVVVPMGVDPEFLQVRAPVSDDVTKDHSIVRFLYLGVISHVRKLELILEAASTVVQENGDEQRFLVDFIGSDETGGYYHTQVDNLNLNGIVRFCPPVPYADIPDTAAAYDVALAIVPEQPRDWQFHPTLKVLEYRALGLPILATDVEPNREIVAHGVNGLLVQNTVESIGSALGTLIQDQKLLHQLRDNAQMMRQGITWSQVAEQYEQVYGQLLHNAR